MAQIVRGLDGQNRADRRSPARYTVTEPAADGYATTYDNCSQIVIPNGGTRDVHDHQRRPACDADRQEGRRSTTTAGRSTASRLLVQVNGGQAQAFEADGQNDLTVPAGTYNVDEPAVAGYTTTYQGCANILLGLGETAAYTVTNNATCRAARARSASRSRRTRRA